MMRISFLRPIDQFDGTHRFLDELKFSLQSNDYDQLRFSVAFAKSGPLLRLSLLIDAWKKNGKKIEAIFGIDLLGTSKQALEFALQHFDRVYILHTENYSTFHPKFYLFSGNNQAVCFQGSHNLTVGGTETNFEGGIKLELNLPDDETIFKDALSAWTSLLPMTEALTASLIQDMLTDGLIFDENVKKPNQPKATSVMPAHTKRTQGKFSKSSPKPPSAIPKEAFLPTPSATIKPATHPPAQQASVIIASTVFSEALVIQIVPHHNGEVFLSKTAVNQNPGFFGFPFTGKTMPKRSGNPSYPQCDPDPVVNITVYDSSNHITLVKLNFALNTVYYSTKSEIRITFSPDLIAVIAPYSIMVLRRTDQAHDYDIDIFNSGTPPSQSYSDYLAACNQTLPAGGKTKARKMGWL